MATIFSRIADGEIPSYKVAEDDRHYAFLDINPVAAGHTLVIPRREVDYLFDLDADELADLMKFAQKVAAGLKAATACARVGMAVIGMDVPHAHIHLIPLNSEGDLDFKKPKLQLPEAEMIHIAAAISENIK
ncbi:MAG: HIT family protein [Muribaculaceae bacterium]|nr:HIT family protein [Muribaculaceae bacterium]MDE6093975.1 HIT family protein [Muribaculaceae bacterium]